MQSVMTEAKKGSWVILRSGDKGIVERVIDGVPYGYQISVGGSARSGERPRRVLVDKWGRNSQSNQHDVVTVYPPASMRNGLWDRYLAYTELKPAGENAIGFDEWLNR